MLLPKKTKYRKYQRGRRRGMSKGQTTVQFGDYGLKALDAAWVTNREIEAARIASGAGITIAMGAMRDRGISLGFAFAFCAAITAVAVVLILFVRPKAQ